MRVTLSRSGGIAYLPGLMSPLTIDSTSLGPTERAALERLVREADFAALPPQVGSAPAGAADQRTYEITVEDEGRSHTVRAIEPIAHPALRSLVNHLEQHRRASRSG